MVPQMKPGNMFQLLDASSLLWRLNVSFTLTHHRIVRISFLDSVSCVLPVYSSLLVLLQVMGIDPGESRWKVVTEAFQVQVGKPSHSWYR